MSKIIRVFPRQTKATPVDENVRIGVDPGLFDSADEVHISVTFTWDLKLAERLYKTWSHIAPTTIGGPATGMKGENFISGMYLKQGYTITSRGCNNSCWFCSVWRREGKIHELSIENGWNVLDDNLLACSESHILKVFEMLKRQPEKPLFTGGLEAKLLTLERAKQIKELRPQRLYFANDTDDDLEPLINAGKLLFEAGFNKKSHDLRAYVLIGFPKDTFENALKRLKQTWDAGFFPMAMLWRNEKGEYKDEWKKFQREWANPVITASNIKVLFE